MHSSDKALGFSIVFNNRKAGSKISQIFIAHFGQQPLRRIRGLTGPVTVKILRNTIHNRSDRQDIQIREQAPLPTPEILIGNVPAAKSL